MGRDDPRQDISEVVRCHAPVYAIHVAKVRRRICPLLIAIADIGCCADCSLRPQGRTDQFVERSERENPCRNYVNY